MFLSEKYSFSESFSLLVTQPVYIFFQIQTLVPIRTNRHYQHLRQLTANDNELTTMSDLTGSKFMRNKPLVLNLQYNKISVFDLGVLRPMIEDHETHHRPYHPSSISFLLAGNPWSCDCEFLEGKPVIWRIMQVAVVCDFQINTMSH